MSDIVDVGLAPNDNLGDPLRTAYQAINSKFTLVDQDLAKRARKDIEETFAANVNFQMISLLEQTADPDDPAEGVAVIWSSDGTETGDGGDILVKITHGGVTKIATIIKFNLLS